MAETISTSDIDAAIRTCAAQIAASNTQYYSVVYTVEVADDGVLTNIQIRSKRT